MRADADLAQAIETLVDGAFFNSGQSCCGIERIYVDARVYDAFVEGAVALTRAYVLGDPLDEATTLGPMVQGRRRRVRARADRRGRARPARAALIDAEGFARDAEGTPYMAPQIVVDVDHEMSLMREESFGPVVGIMKVDSDAEAIRLMNDSRLWPDRGDLHPRRRGGGGDRRRDRDRHGVPEPLRLSRSRRWPGPASRTPGAARPCRGSATRR